MVELTSDQAYARLQSNEQRLRMLEQQLQSIVTALEEIKLTTRALEDLPDTGASGLVPMGGIFLPVTAEASEVKVGVGSGVYIDQKRDEAIDTLKSRQKNLQDTLKRLRESGIKLRNESMEIQRKLQERDQPNVPVISG